MKPFPLKQLLLCVGIALLLSAEECLAQYLQQEPHWRVHTDPTTLTTTVHFFDAEQRLVYQECLPGKYFKLTEKNARKLDRILARKLSQDIVATKMNLLELKDNSVISRKPKAFPFNSFAADWTCQTFVGEDSYLVVWLDNPLKKSLTFTLKDDKGILIYRRRTDHPICQRSFKVSNLGRGTYQLDIADSAGCTYSRNLLVSWPPKKIILQPISFR
jgi:hypothetical protein